MIKNNKIFLQHIFESCEFIEKRVTNTEFQVFEKNDLLQDGVIRRFEMLGEAIKNLSSDFKAQNPDVPWQDIADTRNKLIHDYFGVDIKLVWQMARTDVPKLKLQIKKLIDSHE